MRKNESSSRWIEAARVTRDAERNPQLFAQEFERRAKPKVLEIGRPQPAAEAAHLFHFGVHHGAHRADLVLEQRRVALEGALRLLQAVVERDQPLHRLVVEFARKAGALLLLGAVDRVQLLLQGALVGANLPGHLVEGNTDIFDLVHAANGVAGSGKVSFANALRTCSQGA